MSRPNASPSTDVAMQAAGTLPAAGGSEGNVAATEVKEPAAKSRGRGPAGKVALLVVGVFAAMMTFHVLSDRMAPTSTSGSVSAFTALIAPRVAGEVRTVFVTDNQTVRAGDPLFALDPAPFDLAVRQAEANLTQIMQTVDASSAALISSQLRVTQAKSALESTQATTQRTLALMERGLASQAAADAANTQLTAAQANLDMAEAELNSAVLKTGAGGVQNPQVQAAQVQLEQAQLNRLFATIKAPGDGAITNLKLAVGQYVNAGTPALTFIDSEQPWVMVDLRENQLANVEIGDEVSVLFDGVPGHAFVGRVQGVAWGIDPGRTMANGLPQNQATARWFEPARTIPVHIELADEETWPRNVRVGSKANALIYASGTGNPVAWLAGGMQKVQSVFSFLY
jgi:multidrug resistance efflux pump